MTGALDERRVVVCRPEKQAAGLIDALQQRGAEVVALPLIEVVPPADGARALTEAAARLGEFDWLVLTSANALLALTALAPAPSWPTSLQVVAVGPATSRAVRESGADVAIVPPRATACDLVAAMPAGPGRVLLPQAALAHDELERALAAEGFDVERVTAYDTVVPTLTHEQLSRASAADAAVLTSPSVVDRYLDLAIGVPAVVVCIGPRTAERAVERGIEEPIVADPHTDDGLVAAIVRTLGS